MLNDNTDVRGTKKTPTKTKQKMENAALLESNKIEKESPASNRRRRCLSGSSERPDRYQRSSLRQKDNKSEYIYNMYILIHSLNAAS